MNLGDSENRTFARRTVLKGTAAALALVAANQGTAQAAAEDPEQRLLQLVPGGNGVIFVGTMSPDGSRFNRVFVYRQKDDRLDVTTSNDGEITVDENGERYLTLNNGFEVEGPREQGLNYRLLSYKRNEVAMPASSASHSRGAGS